MKQFLTITLLILFSLGSIAQNKIKFKKEDILTEKKAKLRIGPIFEKLDDQDRYTTILHINDATANRFVESFMWQIGSKKWVNEKTEHTYRYDFYSQTSRPENKALYQIVKVDASNNRKYYIPKFEVIVSSRLEIRKNNELIKTFIFKDNAAVERYYIIYGNEYTLVNKNLLDIVASKAEFRGFAKYEYAFNHLTDTLDKENCIQRSSIIFNDVTLNIDSTMTSRAVVSLRLSYKPQSLHGMLRPGFKILMLNKKSAEKNDKLAEILTNVKLRLEKWASDQQNIEGIETYATRLETMVASDPDNEDIALVCYTTASMCYAIIGDLKKSKVLLDKARDVDNFFGTRTKTASLLYKILNRKDIITKNDIIEYNSL